MYLVIDSWITGGKNVTVYRGRIGDVRLLASSRWLLAARNNELIAISLGFLAAGVLRLLNLEVDIERIWEFVSIGMLAVGESLFFIWLMVKLVRGLMFLLRRSTGLDRGPGRKLLSLAEVLFSQKVYFHVLEPTICDLQGEYAQALAEEGLWSTRWVLLRGYWSFWSAVVVQALISLAKYVSGVRRPDQRGDCAGHSASRRDRGQSRES